MNLKSKLYIIKHSSGFTYSILYPRLYLAFCSSQNGCRTMAFLVDTAFVSRTSVRRQRTALRRMLQLRRFLGLNSKSYLAIAKDTAWRGFCWNVCWWCEDERKLRVDETVGYIIASCVNTFLFLSKWSIPYIASHPLKGCNQAHTTDFWMKLHNTLTFALILCCSEREARQLWRHKIQFRQFSEVSTNRSVCKAKKNSCFQGRISRPLFDQIM